MTTTKKDRTTAGRTLNAHRARGGSGTEEHAAVRRAAALLGSAGGAIGGRAKGPSKRRPAEVCRKRWRIISACSGFTIREVKTGWKVTYRRPDATLHVRSGSAVAAGIVMLAERVREQFVTLFPCGVEEPEADQ